MGDGGQFKVLPPKITRASVKKAEQLNLGFIRKSLLHEQYLALDKEMVNLFHGFCQIVLRIHFTNGYIFSKNAPLISFFL